MLIFIWIKSNFEKAAPSLSPYLEKKKMGTIHFARTPKSGWTLETKPSDVLRIRLVECLAFNTAFGRYGA